MHSLAMKQMFCRCNGNRTLYKYELYAQVLCWLMLQKDNENELFAQH